MRLSGLPVFAAALLLQGCIATQRDMLQMQSQMDDLNMNLSAMQKNQADLAVKIDGLSRDLNVFSENVKGVTTQMERLSGRLDQMETGLDKRVNAIGKTLQKQQEQVESALLPSKLYNDSYAAFSAKNYDNAAAGFKSYISKYPSGEMAEVACFYLGEAYYNKGAWQDAALAYATLLDKYPSSSKAPAARLGYAQALLKFPQDKKAEAVSFLESVVKDFPKSPEAKTAREQLSRLNPPAPKPAAKPAAPAKK
ncbi:MAG TPA: hypothetical protein DDW67_01790 [Elusimicrobia bacterium]|jgi:tol-pal system protein YbgF|nr:hypothetical protein [Elusimicrobiota bacterium]